MIRWAFLKCKSTNIPMDTGQWGESKARQSLEAEGYQIIGSRIRVGKRDEIDLLARDGDVLVFIEVKTRASEQYGRPGDSIKRAKRHALSRAAVRYLKSLRHPPAYFRFDVVEVIGSPEKGLNEIRHICNAFPLQAPYDLPY